MEKKLIGDRNEKFEDVDDKGRNFGTDHGRKYYWGITVIKNHNRFGFFKPVSNLIRVLNRFFQTKQNFIKYNRLK